MRKRAVCIAFIVSSTVACSFRLWVGVVNDTDAAVELLTSRQHVVVGPRSVGRVYYGELTIIRNGCSGHYALPVGSALPGYNTTDQERRVLDRQRTVYMELRPDDILYLLPPGTKEPVSEVNRDERIGSVRVAPGETTCYSDTHRAERAE